ncbi:HNH endonuclease [Streptomyces erythrochromogenes]|uniref:HNH endonuclease n=1 Tax=Streptomyces erythrochromogenes TaxID=285574 RepID=UPI0036A74DF8
MVKRTPEPGAKRRLAEYLATEIGEGGTFTLEQLREAVPHVLDLPRRLRDLKAHDWELATPRETGTGSYQLLKIGEKVWEPLLRRQEMPRLRQARQRAAVLARDGYRCMMCGTGAGEPDASDLGETAHLEVAFRTPIPAGGTDHPDNLLTLCANCHRAFDRGGWGGTADSALEQLQDLSVQQKTVLLAWMAAGQRTLSPVERAWTAYRRLSPEDQELLRRELASEIEQLAGDHDLAR